MTHTADNDVAEWQDIATAPKDGTLVDLYGTRNGEPRRFPNGKWSQEVFGGNYIDRWSWSHYGWDIYGEFEYTHWRPVPAPPARQALPLAEEKTSG